MVNVDKVKALALDARNLISDRERLTLEALIDSYILKAASIGETRAKVFYKNFNKSAMVEILESYVKAGFTYDWIEVDQCWNICWHF